MEISIRELLQPEPLLLQQHITDAFLLGLAVHEDGKLAIFDQRKPLEAGAGEQVALGVLAHTIG